MKRLLRISWAGLLIAGTLGGCGLTEGDQGSESHWLTGCEVDADCSVGSCLCGACTVRCDTAFDCPYPLDACSSGSDAVDNGTCTTPPDSSVCGVSTPERRELSTSSVSASRCDGERSSSLYLLKDLEGAAAGIALGEEGYALFSGGYVGRGVTTVGAAGELRQQLALQSVHVTELQDMVQMPDGSFVLSGYGVGLGDSFNGTRGWVGKVDRNWNPVWETEVGSPGAYTAFLAALPDGGVIAAGTTWEAGLGEDPPPADWVPTFFWERLNADGQVTWRHDQEIDGLDEFVIRKSILALTPAQEVRIVVPSNQGLVMIRSDLDGAFESTVLETSLALYPSGIVALPDERIAIASSRAPGAVLSVLNADGSVAWEKVYGAPQDAEANAVAYDPTRNELVLGGSYRGDDNGTQRTWLIATDLDGNQTFEMTRQPQSTYGDGEASEVEAGRGPGIDHLAVSPGGQILAVADTTFQLMYFLIGPEACE